MYITTYDLDLIEAQETDYFGDIFVIRSKNASQTPCVFYITSLYHRWIVWLIVNKKMKYFHYMETYDNKKNYVWCSDDSTGSTR